MFGQQEEHQYKDAARHGHATIVFSLTSAKRLWAFSYLIGFKIALGIILSAWIC